MLNGNFFSALFSHNFKIYAINSKTDDVFFYFPQNKITYCVKQNGRTEIASLELNCNLNIIPIVRDIRTNI